MSIFEVSTETALAVSLWAIVLLGAISPGSVPQDGPLAMGPDDYHQSTYDPPRITPAEAQARMAHGERIVLVDVRPTEAYKHEHIDGAISAPWRDLSKGFGLLPRDRLLLLYCT